MLLPRPRSVSHRPDVAFPLTPDLAVDGPAGWAAVVRRLLSPGTGLELPRAEGGALRLRSDEELPVEGYRLEVDADGITITAGDDAGVNWAVQTLRQLLPPAVLRPAPSGAPLLVEGVQVEDAPAYAWRGVHLDVGRHFMPLADVFRMVDLIALHKYNVLHLHLTEDQGWRFESLRYPRLQEVASWRRETRRHHDTEGDGTPHGGYYTQDQLRALVAYAEQRGVTIKVGTDASYAPNEFLAGDGKTVQGMDVDVFNAVAAKLGVTAEFQPADFSSIITGVQGGKYDVGVSSFTINDERKQQVNMVSYFSAGTQWATAAGNPEGIDPDDACGKTIG